ncbi:acetyl-coenzyme A thioesterase-like isoform X1 [Styela clava]
MFTLANLVDGLMYLWRQQQCTTVSKLHSRMDFADMEDKREIKSPEKTKVEMCQIIQSSHIDKYGHLSCGQLLKWVDISACLAAEKLAGCSCVTVSVDDLYFEDQVHLGEIICLKSKVNRAFNTSMEVGVQVTKEHLGGEKKTICEAFLTFVALNRAGRKIKLPPFLCESHSEEICYSLAEERKRVRISHSRTITHLVESYEADCTESDEEETTDGPVVNGLLTRVESVELVLPQHANHHGNTFGGQILAWVENIGSISAARFVKDVVKLRSVDMVHFRGSSQVGDRIVLQSIVNCAFEKSLEVGVRVDAYNCEEGEMGELRHINSAFLTFESELELPALNYNHDEDGIRRHREAIARGKIRLDRRYILSGKRKEKLSVVLNENNLMYLSLNNISTMSELASKTDWKKVSSENKLTLSTLESDGILKFKVHKRLCSSKVTDYHAYKILSDPRQRTQWDPLMESCDLIRGAPGVDDCVYHTVMRSSVNEDENVKKRNYFDLLYSCREPTIEGEPYIIAMRSVVVEGGGLSNEIDHEKLEVACAGFTIYQEPGQNTEISYYNETNPKLVSYITRDVAGFSKLYSIIYKKMEKYIVDKLID